MSDIDSIKIGSITYEVRVIERLLGDNDKKLDGQITYSVPKIELDSNLSPVMRRQVLWHEIVHGILTQAGRQDEVSEGAVDALAYGILGVINDNPKIWLPSREPLESEK
jgi:Zn-dependent peptidase ImmA (M78 family)